MNLENLECWPNSSLNKRDTPNFEITLKNIVICGNQKKVNFLEKLHSISRKQKSNKNAFSVEKTRDQFKNQITGCPQPATLG